MEKKLKKTNKSEFESRKVDHIRFALDSRSQNLADAGYGRIRLVHQALPEMAFSDVDLKCRLLGKPTAVPLFVSSMTAGHAQGKKVNLRLARAAEERNWVMCVGSQRRELFDGSAGKEWTNLRKEAPRVRLVSNIGIEELIQTPLPKILKLVENASAEAIIVHLNSVQEVIQKKFNTDCNLRGGLKCIASLVKVSPVPVIVKEVGFGFSLETIQQLADVGVTVVDLSGRGGSHWGMIEALRSQDSKPTGGRMIATAEAFADWGYSNIDMLLAIQTAKKWEHKDSTFQNTKNKKIDRKAHLSSLQGLEIWASGGIRNGVHALKCLALGAKAVGVAQPLMQAAIEGEKALLNAMIDFENQVKLGMFAMGVVNLDQLQDGKYWYE